MISTNLALKPGAAFQSVGGPRESVGLAKVSPVLQSHGMPLYVGNCLALITLYNRHQQSACSRFGLFKDGVT